MSDTLPWGLGSKSSASDVSLGCFKLHSIPLKSYNTTSREAVSQSAGNAMDLGAQRGEIIAGTQGNRALK